MATLDYYPSSSSSLAPPLGYPMGHGNPREAMRRAKLAVMEDEVRETTVKREARNKRRKGSEASGSSRGRSKKGSGSNMLSPDMTIFEEPPIPSSSPFLKSPTSILRTPPGFTAPDVDSSPVNVAGPSRWSPEQPVSPRAPNPPCPAPGPRRRSSRVRFSEETLGSANSSPTGSVVEGGPHDNRPEIRLVTPSAATSPNTISDSQMPLYSPLISPMSGISAKSSAGSVSSSASDPFGLQCACGSPPPKTLPRSNSANDEFQPRPLPYTRLSKVLDRLELASANIPSGGTSLDMPSPRSSRVLSTDSPSRGLSTSTNASIGPKMSIATSRRDDSLVSRDNSLVSAVSSTPSADFGLPPRLDGGGAAYASLLPISEGTPSPDEKTPMLNRQPWLEADMGLSPRSGPSPVPVQSGIMDQPLGVPKMGIRMEHCNPVIEPRISHVELPESVLRPQHEDSVDMLPGPEGAVSVDTTEAYRSLGISAAGDPVSMVKEAAVIQQPTSTKKGHLRNVSDFSVDLPFPVPPDRLNVTVGRLVMPPSQPRKAILSPALMATSARAMVEEYFAEQTPALVGMTKRASSDSASTAKSIMRPSSLVKSSPIPDAAYSLSAHIQQIGGSPSAHDQTLPPTPIDCKIPVEAPSEPVATTAAAPDSPKLGDLIEQTLRIRRSTVGYNFEEEESDLDVATPLVEAAVRHRIVSPSSKLLSKNAGRSRARKPTPSTLSARSAGELDGLGWSGSESEEEEWAQTIREIALRRTSKPNLSTQARVRLPGSKSLPLVGPRPATWKSRYSQASSVTSSSDMSGMTTASSSTTTIGGTELITPSASLDIAPAARLVRGPSPGPYPWGRSPRTSPVKPPSAQLGSPDVMVTPKSSISRRSSGTPMPLPTRDEEWGEPEIINDEQESEAELTESPGADESDLEWYWEPRTRTLSSEKRKKSEAMAVVSVVLADRFESKPQPVKVVPAIAQPTLRAIAADTALVSPMSKPTPAVPVSVVPASPNVGAGHVSMPHTAARNLVISVPELSPRSPAGCKATLQNSPFTASAQPQASWLEESPRGTVVETMPSTSSPVLDEPVPKLSSVEESPQGTPVEALPEVLPPAALESISTVEILAPAQPFSEPEPVAVASPGVEETAHPTPAIAARRPLPKPPAFSRLPIASRKSLPIVTRSVDLPPSPVSATRPASKIPGATPAAQIAPTAIPTSRPATPESKIPKRSVSYTGLPTTPRSRVPSIARKAVPSDMTPRPNQKPAASAAIPVLAELASPAQKAAPVLAATTAVQVAPTATAPTPAPTIRAAPVVPPRRVSQIPVPKRLVTPPPSPSRIPSLSKPSLSPKSPARLLTPKRSHATLRSSSSTSSLSPSSAEPEVPDTAAAFLARARANAKRIAKEQAELLPSPLPSPMVSPVAPVRTPSPLPAPSPVASPVPEPGHRPTLTPRIPLGSRLADLIAKRDAATAARSAIDAESREAKTMIKSPEVDMMEMLEKAPHPAELIQPEVVLTAAMKGKGRQIQAPSQTRAQGQGQIRRPMAVQCTASRFF